LSQQPNSKEEEEEEDREGDFSQNFE